jgi:hypothetical protein
MENENVVPQPMAWGFEKVAPEKGYPKTAQKNFSSGPIFTLQNVR